MTEHLALAIGAGTGMLAAIGVYLSARLGPRSRHLARPADRADDTEIALLVESGHILDATPAAADMLALESLRGASWQGVRDALLPRFPAVPESLPAGSACYPAATGGHATLHVEPAGSCMRVTLCADPLDFGQQQRMALGHTGQERLGAVMRAVPHPIWQSDAAGQTVWGNAAFEALRRRNGGDAAPNAPFPLAASATGSQSHKERVSLPAEDGETHWYEVTTEPLRAGALHVATCIDGLVAAENAQRNFVQTLTKTFAHLPIGLAVFDRDRQLVLFNPALVDLTRLPVDFLSARPNLMSFFDHMRENRIMPEPKDYASWRVQLAELISAARDDRYCETWNLSSGLTYKITGRPHPDGAIAFLIEDISGEISLTRRFRSELQISQSILDSLEDAVSVFNQLGVLTFSNAAFRTLWQCDPDSAFAEMTIVDATQLWQRACDPRADLAGSPGLRTDPSRPGRVGPRRHPA